MNTITVNKNDLIERLRINREAHVVIFDKAQEVYREQMVAELDRALADAKAGRKIVRMFSLPVPEEHTDDFDTAIAMLEWDTGEEIEINLAEFKMYVENEWGWQRSFAGNTQSYLAE
jgi:hypothetical protein